MERANFLCRNRLSSEKAGKQNFDMRAN